MSAKKIDIGEIHISSWDPNSGKMFSYEYYYDQNHFFYSDFCKKQVKKCDPEKVVLPPNGEYTLIIDYPVNTPYTAKFKTGKMGMTRIKFAETVCEHYRKMYAEGDKYGIWGHDIGDLILIDAELRKSGNITLGVDS